MIFHYFFAKKYTSNWPASRRARPQRPCKCGRDFGPPRGGHDRRHLASAKGILSDPKSNTVLMRSPNVFGIFSLQILRFYWKSTILSNFRGLQYMIFRKIRCFWTVIDVSFRFSVFFHVLITFWSIPYGALEFRFCFFDDFSIFERALLIFMILSDFASMARAKQHRERQKWMRFYTFSQVGRRRVFLTNATPGFVFFVIIL